MQTDKTDYTKDVQPPKIPGMDTASLTADGSMADANGGNNNDDNDDREDSTSEGENESRAASIGAQLSDIVASIADKIKASENILVALSKDPSIDEISAAIGLTMILDKLGKHVTAIFSGKVPNALEFLRPNETFEKDTNSLQDFIIAINKDKADHLRYKIEGDYVKVYITPYRTMISEKDLEFDRGDYNVDLVITIDVESGESIDGALSEYGRIMHDATAINITTNAPGHFAETEWSEMADSSVCEMVVKLADKLGFDDYDENIATALLTGIVAGTNRFSNERTTPETMAIASRLMTAGGDQQLISSNIMKEALGDHSSVASTTPISSDAHPINPNEPVELSSDTEIVIDKVPEAPASPEAPAVPEAPVAVEAPVAAEAPAVPATPAAPEAPAAPEPVVLESIDHNPADLAAPVVTATSDDTVPTVQYTAQPVAPPLPDLTVAPPAPQIDFNVPSLPPEPATAPTMPNIPAEPTIPAEPVAPVAPIPQPVASSEPLTPPAQSYTAQPPDPAAFRIPGM